MIFFHCHRAFIAKAASELRQWWKDNFLQMSSRLTTRNKQLRRLRTEDKETTVGLDYKIKIEWEATDCTLVIFSTLNEEANVFLYLYSCRLLSLRHPHSTQSPMSRGRLVPVFGVQSPPISPPTCHHRKGAAVIASRLMNGDTLIFVIPNWCSGFD